MNCKEILTGQNMRFKICAQDRKKADQFLTSQSPFIEVSKLPL